MSISALDENVYTPTWITPKTNWTKTTPFTYEDYNRILNNCEYLMIKYHELYPDIPTPEGYFVYASPKTGYGDVYSPHDFNYFEQVLDYLTQITHEKKNVGDTKRYHDNDPFIDYNDLNRIEKSILAWYTQSEKDYEIIKLPYNLQDGSATKTGDGSYAGIEPCIHIAGSGNKNFYSYNIKTKKWSKGTDLPYKMNNGCLVSDGLNTVYLIGGDSNEETKKCYKLYVKGTTDTNSAICDKWIEIKEYPFKVYHTANRCEIITESALSRKRFLYILGGARYVQEGEYELLEPAPSYRLDISKNNASWKKNSKPTVKMDIEYTTYLNNKFYFIANYYYETPLSENKLYCSEVVNVGDDVNQIQEVATLPTISGHFGAIVACRGTIYFIKDAVCYKLVNNSFVHCCDLPYAVSDPCVITCKNEIYIIGGDYNNKDKMIKLLKY